jgi:hypothetical protein
MATALSNTGASLLRFGGTEASAPERANAGVDEDALASLGISTIDTAGAGGAKASTVVPA